MLQTTATILQLCIFITYISYIKQRFGILDSISDSTYALQGQQRHLFLFFCWSIAILNFFQPMEIYGFFASVGLFFAGITIDHKSYRAHTRPIHIAGAVLAIASSFAGLLILYGMWYSLLMFMFACIPFLKEQEVIWYVEILAISIILISYFTI